MSKAISKNQFRDRLSKRLAAELRLSVVPDHSGTAAWDLLYRREKAPLVLTIGTQLSSHEPEQFTCAAYLAPSFHWGYTPKGFPLRAYRRLGSYLEPRERERLLPPDLVADGVVDAWWRGFDDEALEACVAAAVITLPRFLGQPGLFDELRESPPLEIHARMLAEIRELAGTLDSPPRTLRHQPRSPLRGVSEPWCWAAEVVSLRHRPEIANPKYTELLARDAFLMATLP